MKNSLILCILIYFVGIKIVKIKVIVKFVYRVYMYSGKFYNY